MPGIPLVLPASQSTAVQDPSRATRIFHGREVAVKNGGVDRRLRSGLNHGR